MGACTCTGSGSSMWRQASVLRSWAWERGLACGVCAALIFSFSSLQVKLTGGRVPALELAIIRSSISFCTSVGVGTASHIKPMFGHRENLALLFMRGLFGTLAITCSYFAVLNLPLGDAVTLSQLRPPVTAVMAWLLLREPLGWHGAGGCAVSLAGAVLIAHPPFLFGGHAAWGPRRLLGTACGLASPVFGAGTSYCIRRIGKREPALVVALWFHTVTVSLLAWPLLASWPERARAVAAHDAALLLGISCTSFCAQLLMTRAYQLLPAARASCVSFIGVIIAHILGAAVFDEHLTSTALLGGALIFVGVVMATLKTKGGSNSSDGSSSKAGGAVSADVEAQQPLKAGVPEDDDAGGTEGGALPALVAGAAAAGRPLGQPSSADAGVAGAAALPQPAAPQLLLQQQQPLHGPGQVQLGDMQQHTAPATPFVARQPADEARGGHDGPTGTASPRRPDAPGVPAHAHTRCQQPSLLQQQHAPPPALAASLRRLVPALQMPPAAATAAEGADEGLQLPLLHGSGGSSSSDATPWSPR